MNTGCHYPLCRSLVPSVLASEGLCPLHFIRKIDLRCREIRRETLRGELSAERRLEMNEYLYAQAIILAQIATSGTRLNDETRPCLLSVFLTLINVCERVARTSIDQQHNTGITPLPRLATAWPAAAAK
jgi:hypothetical protein